MIFYSKDKTNRRHCKGLISTRPKTEESQELLTRRGKADVTGIQKEELSEALAKKTGVGMKNTTQGCVLFLDFNGKCHMVTKEI